MRRWWFLLIGVGLALMAVLPVTASSPDNGQVVSIPFSSPAELAELAARLDIWEVHRDTQNPDSGYVVAYVSAAEVERLTAAGIAVQPAPGIPVHPETIPGFPCYRTVDEMYAQLDQWAAQYPELTQSLTIGQSYESRSLRVMRLTNEATGTSHKPV